MARTTVRAGGLRLTVQAEGMERKSAQFKDARTRIARDARVIVRQAAEQTVLPVATARASTYKVGGRAIRLKITKGVRSDSATMTTRFTGVRARAVGLLEFGGTVRTTIRPTGKQALSFGGGHPVARVTTPRVYHARMFLTHARDAALPAFGDNVRNRLVGEFAAAGFEVR